MNPYIESPSPLAIAVPLLSDGSDWVSAAWDTSEASTIDTVAQVRANLWEVLWNKTLPSLQAIARSPLLADMLSPRNPDGSWTTRADANIFNYHFPAANTSIPLDRKTNPACPVVPLTGLISLYMLTSGKTRFACKIQQPVGIGDTFAWSPDGQQLMNTLPEWNVFLKFTDVEEGLRDLTNHISIPDTAQLAPVSPIALPHAPELQMVDEVSFGESQNTEWIRGTYTVKEATPYLTSSENGSSFDLALLPECASQMLAAAGDKFLPEGHIYTFEGGKFHLNPDITYIPVGSKLTLEAQVIENTVEQWNQVYGVVFCMKNGDQIILTGRINARSMDRTKLGRVMNLDAKKRSSAWSKGSGVRTWTEKKKWEEGGAT